MNKKNIQENNKNENKNEERKKNKLISFLIAGGVTIAVLILTIVLNLYFAAPYTGRNAPVSIQGTIEFDGGHDFGSSVVYVNPVTARPVASDHTGIEAKSLNWWITRPGENDALYSSQSHDLEQTFLFMRDSGHEGTYVLQFQVEASSGNIYRMGRNFHIAAQETSEN